MRGTDLRAAFLALGGFFGIVCPLVISSPGSLAGYGFWFTLGTVLAWKLCWSFGVMAPRRGSPRNRTRKESVILSNTDCNACFVDLDLSLGLRRWGLSLLDWECFCFCTYTSTYRTKMNKKKC
jgi:hypothetical protein